MGRVFLWGIQQDDTLTSRTNLTIDIIQFITVYTF